MVNNEIPTAVENDGELNSMISILIQLAIPVTLSPLLQISLE